MPGRMITPLSDIAEDLNRIAERRRAVAIETMQYVGEQCIIEARLHGSYTDQTGNLRSSIGYAVLDNGKVVAQEQSEKVKNGDEGITEGAKFLQQCVRKASKKGIVLIVTAGMNYAEYVEAKGRVVLSSAELKAPIIARRLLSQLGFKFK